ncbi:hypothetical protein LPUS_06655 [Lasallia pustulata]|uniref:Uncharacterized protein n=1 Tax=Lasallia pustulata TaxID=136370 RepID=A0A1W5D1C0_9LECA|nr:hypothetical protein LPUS_06655 [Lasallia pustulata]
MQKVGPILELDIGKLHANCLEISLINSSSGSGGTHISVSSRGLDDNSSASARFSSSSTLPSSDDIPPDEDSLANPKGPYKAPFPAVAHSHSGFSLRAAAGRTFSFGRKPFSSSTTSSLGNHPKTSFIDSPESLHGSRDRALTESSYASASTATPSKFLGTSLDFEESDLDDFGNMFGDLEKEGSRQQYDEQAGMGVTTSASPDPISPAPPGVAAGQYSGASSPYTPPPTNILRLRESQLSPYSTGSHGSQDGLMTSFSPPATEESLFDYGESPPVPRHVQGVSASRYVPLKERNDAANRPGPDPIDPNTASTPRKSSAYFSRRCSSPMQDEDAKLLTDALGASRKWSTEGEIRSQISSSDGSSSVPASSSGRVSFRKVSKANKILRKPVAPFDSEEAKVSVAGDSWTLESAETTPRPKKLQPVQLEEPALPSSSFTEAAGLALRFQEGDGQDEQDQRDQSPARKVPQTKVMTPVQFEQYRKEQEAWRTTFNAPRSEPSDDESDRDEDEDDAERNRQLAKQRRQQEAHLAVYRQQMMKVTGEKPAELPSRSQPRMALARASLSSPNLSAEMSSINLGNGKPVQGARNSEDEDEDIPLGILAAHGFPSKSRSPTAMASAGFTPSIRFQSETYPRPPASISGEPMSGRPRSGLPVFARNLPPDPYYGAGLVNPSNRESLAFGNSARSTYGGTPPNLPPGGLVGVIVGEERAKALRRGSPNAQGGLGYDPNLIGSGMPHMQPGISPNMSMGNLNAMGPTGMPVSPGMPMMTPGDQAQVQMSQQMTQMMQMQMQWMQQMQQMVQMQGSQPGQQQGPPIPPQHQQMQPNNSSFFTPPGTTMSRPMSMAHPPVPHHTGPPQRDQRAMSMLDPPMSAQWPQQRGVSRNSSYGPSTMAGASGAAAYAYPPSIAPSERSNVGMPSRYRPVSTMEPPDEEGRTVRKCSGVSSSSLDVSSAALGGSSVADAVGVIAVEEGDEGWG